METTQTAQIGMPLLPEHVARTRHDVPGDVCMFQGDVYGPGALLACIRQIAEARTGTVTYAETAPDPTRRPYRDVRRIVSVGWGKVEGRPCFRYCGEGGSPDGNSSHSVIPTWYPGRCTDANEVAAELCFRAHGEIFILADYHNNASDGTVTIS